MTSLIPKNRIWQVLLILMTLVALWFTGNAFVQLYHYIRLSAETEGHVTSWSIKQLSEERYVLHANYTFTIPEGTYNGEMTLQQPHFLNAWAAEQTIPEFQSKRWTVWYSAWNPHYSALQKSFPFKECLSALLLWGVLFYFIGLNYYVSKQ